MTGSGYGSWRHLARMTLVAAAYFGLAKAGIALAAQNTIVTAVWPPTGVALAALLIWGYRVWPGVAVGAFLAEASTGVPLLTAAGMTIGNTLEALLGAFLLVRVARFRPSLERVRDVFALVALAAVASTTVSATFGVASLWLGNQIAAGDLASSWRVWWLGDMSGDLLVAPLILVVATARRRPAFDMERIVEALGLVALVVLASMIVFSHDAPLTFLVLPPLIWAALRFRQLGATVGTLVVTGISIWYTAHGQGPFAMQGDDIRLLISQAFMTVASITALLLAAVMTERERAKQALLDAHDELEARVHERTAQLEQSVQELAFQSTIGATMAEGIVLVKASNSSIVYASPTFERMFGYEPRELEGLAAWRLNANGDREPVAVSEEIMSAVRDSGSWHGEVHNVKKDGTPFWSWANVSAFEHPQHGTVWLSVQGDITDRKLAEDKLVRSEAQLAEAQRIASVGSWEWDIARNEITWSDELYRIHGEDPNQFEASFEAFLKGVHPDDRALVETVVGKAIADCEPFEYEYRCVLPGGSERVLHAHGRVEADPRGRAVKMLGTCQDVSALRRAERPLRHLAAIVESSEDAIFSKTLDGTIDTWNPGAEKLYGYSAEEIIGRHVSVLIPPEDREAEQKIMDDLLAGGRVLGYEAERVGKNGKRLEMSLTVSPIKDAGGSIIGFSSISRDVSEQKRIKEEADRLKDEFFATVSHELRTPLTSIIGYTDLLLRGGGELDDQQRHFLEITERNAARQLRLVNDLLFVSRAEAGEFVIEWQKVQLGKIVSECVESAKPTAQDKQIHLVDMVESMPTCRGDKDRLAQLVDNLVSNAIKFTPRGGRVEVRLTAEHDSCCLEVANTGSYIGLDEQKHLFDRFYRTESASDQAVQGIGLGLTISKAIVDAHDGTIGVKSENGEGTVFRVTLPLRNDPNVFELRRRKKEIAA